MTSSAKETAVTNVLDETWSTIGAPRAVVGPGAARTLRSQAGATGSNQDGGTINIIIGASDIPEPLPGLTATNRYITFGVERQLGGVPFGTGVDGNYFGICAMAWAPGGVARFGLGQGTDGAGANVNACAIASIAPLSIAGHHEVIITSIENGDGLSQVALQGNLNLGLFTQAMNDQNTVMPATGSSNTLLLITGINTQVRALTLSTPPAAGVLKFIRNNCSVFGITVKFVSGAATATIPPGSSALICGDGTNAVILMSGN